MRERAVRFGLGAGGLLGAASGVMHHAAAAGLGWLASVLGAGAVLVTAAFLRDLVNRETSDRLTGLPAHRR